MQQEIPVITVVPVMGTTEEGAVDPLTEILALKDEFKKQVSWRFLKELLLSQIQPKTVELGWV